MNGIGQFHPLIVHTPIAMVVFSAFFAIVGLLFDREWVRKASVLMLVFGFLGAFAAVQSGKAAHRVPEHEQGVPEHAIDEHGEGGEWVVRDTAAALVALFVASRLKGRAASVLRGVALVLQLMAAVAVGLTGYRGGKLVYEHGANVRIGGVLVRDVGAAAPAVAPGEPAPDRDHDDGGK